MSLAFTPLSSKFGAVVEGLDLRGGVSAPEAASLRDGLARHRVLSIPAPEAGPDEFLAIARAFGELEPFFLSAYSLESHPEIYVLSNIRKDGAPIGRDGAGFHWHSDHTFQDRPCSATLLHGVTCPSEGGDTLFVDMVDAYERLSEAERRRLDGLRAVHKYQKKEFAFTAERGADAETAAKIENLKRLRAEEDAARPPSASSAASGAVPEVAHPVVRTHPVTGEKALYLNEEMTTGIEGMAEAEGRALLRDLAVHATPDENILRYKWKTGDIVIWDNASTMHSATYTDPACDRLMHRLTIRGEEPF
ncbi:MAG: TauD/TfdA family dioxygenase [Pseudomonadota bacterium]